MSKNIKSSVVVSKYSSNGIWKRLYNLWEASGIKGDVNHITGDVHYLALALRKKKTILTIHDCYILYWNKGLARLFFKIFWFWLPVRMVKYVVAISEATKNELLKFTNCDPNKIIIIPVFISELYKRHLKPFNKEKPVLLHIGLAPNKNLERLIEAIEGITCHLSIVGKLTEEHKAKLARHNIEYSYVFNISDEEMLEKYNTCDVLTFISIYEGFGMPIVEANTVGRAVLTSNISSMPYVANDAACLVDPYDVADVRKGLLKIIHDDNYREQLIENGFKNRLRFQPDLIAQQYEALYLKVAGRESKTKVDIKEQSKTFHRS